MLNFRTLKKSCFRQENIHGMQFYFIIVDVQLNFNFWLCLTILPKRKLIFVNFFVFILFYNLFLQISPDKSFKFTFYLIHFLLCTFNSEKNVIWLKNIRRKSSNSFSILLHNGIWKNIFSNLTEIINKKPKERKPFVMNYR